MDVFPTNECGEIDYNLAFVDARASSFSVDLSHMPGHMRVRYEPGYRGPKGSETAVYRGVERRMNPHKHRDEGERRLGAPRSLSAGMTALIRHETFPMRRYVGRQVPDPIKLVTVPDGRVAAL